MRKVAYILNNSNYLSIIESFCKEEGFEPVLYGSEENGCYMFFICDDKKTMELIPNDYSRCLISLPERDISSYHTISPDFDIYTLRFVLDKLLHGNFFQNTTNSFKCLSSVQKFEISSNASDIERFIYEATSHLLYSAPFCDVEKIRIGLSEIITNAIEHGNLNITNEEKHKTTEDGTFNELIEIRKKDPRYKDKKVYVDIDSDEKHIKIVVRDEGNGFDISKLPSPTDLDQLLKLHGRGILIARAYFNEVTYNDKGNEVTLIRAL